MPMSDKKTKTAVRAERLVLPETSFSTKRWLESPLTQEFLDGVNSSHHTWLQELKVLRDLNIVDLPGWEEEFASPLSIGLDVDEVIYPWMHTFRDYLVGFEGYDRDKCAVIEAYEFYTPWGVESREEFIALMDRGVQSGLLHSAGLPIEGSVEGAQRLLELGHDVHLVTARCETDAVTVERTTGQWLTRFGVPYTTLTFSADKTVVDTDLFVDDSVRNLHGIRDAGILPLMMNAEHNVHDREFLRVPNLSVAVDIANSLARTRSAIGA